MKKSIFLLSLILLLNILSFPQAVKSSTTITSVQVQGQSVHPASWESIIINSSDTITFFFSTDYKTTISDKTGYKLFLDDNQLESSENQFITLKNLAAGIHVFKASAYSLKKGELRPASLKFTVKNNAEIKNGTTPKEKDLENGGEGNKIIIYVLLGVIAILIIVIFILLKGRKGSNGNVSETQKSLPKDESEDYKYSYEKIKKEAKNLIEANNFLKIQITELKAYIKDLEDANVQLVTQKEKLQESNRQLSELQRQKDELFAIAVHDIKNPASIIKGLIELLTDYDLNAKEQQQIMQSLSETSIRIIDLAQKMSQVCARTQPEPEMLMEAASLKDIIDSVYKRNMAYANSKNIKLINNTSLNTPNVKVDKGKIDEVIDNLINNAIKYGPEGTVVQVKSFFNQSKVTVEINDTGAGFSEEDMKKVFQKGMTLSTMPTGGETRSGLGLWIVKKIIEDHGGKITLESKKGHGSRFIFDLPINKN